MSNKNNYHKYKKYKRKYLNSKLQLYSFIDDGLADTHIIIFKAKDEKDAYGQLDELDAKSEISQYSSNYALTTDIDEIKKSLYKNKIKPVIIDAPMLFTLYNG